MSKIELTEHEIKVIRQYFDGEIEVHSATAEQQKHMMSVISKAEALMHELKAYEESGNDMIRWFWGKYQQQGADGNL